MYKINDWSASAMAVGDATVVSATGIKLKHGA
jgi:hypothetical protein